MNHDEYTDYSCSTSIERLARDVETILRKWHLSGSDRHIAFSDKEHTKGDRTNQPLGPDLRENSDEEQNQNAGSSNGVSGSIILDLGTDKETNHLAASTKPSHLTTKTLNRERSIVQLIRNHPVDWTVSLTGDVGKVTLLLNLDLWDGPCDDNESDLPKSLRRVPLGTMPIDLFSDLSTAFGIGQHLTLSLKKDQELTDAVVWTLGGSLVQRHDSNLTPWVATAILSNILQTSLQCALSAMSCNIPAFGIWGSYNPASFDSSQLRNSFRDHAPLLPDWIQEWNTPNRKRTSIFRLLSDGDSVNQFIVPPILKSTMLCETTQFWMSVMPTRVITTSRLTAWGDLLLYHSSTQNVMLVGAKHLYICKKPNSTKLREISEWRQGLESTVDVHGATKSKVVSMYQEECRQYAMSLLERFSGASLSDPLWGPVDDPINFVNIIVRWDPKTTDDGFESLLSMPLKIRSEKDMTMADWAEMEDAVESSVLNPLQPSSFEINTVYDPDTSLANLAASLRLLLAALIRTAVLPATTMMHQLTDEAELDAFSNEHVDAVTETLVNRAGVGVVTRHLVEAVDWATQSDELIEGWEAERVVQKVMDGRLTLKFPDPPEQVLVDSDGCAPTDLFAPLTKSAPAGRLLSILFVHMSRLRSPASIALVWTYLVHDLQKRFYSRTSLPNMAYIPGIDRSPNSLSPKNCFSTSGLRVKAENSAFVHCSEPQPDDMSCLIGQKLQVFNIVIESLVATDAYNATRLNRSFKQDLNYHPKANSGSVDFVFEPLKDATRVEKAFDERSHSSFIEFHDANENGSDDGFSDDGDQIFLIERRGARCPVLGVNLIDTGDQLYAPYLRRPIPWTDDVLLERRSMLSKLAKGTTVVERLEVAHRYLKPKLYSDMQAFKAANPGANFEDFTNWYGNPANPLEEFDRAAAADGWFFLRADDDDESYKTSDSPSKLERALQIVNYTRDFWLDTWDEADPVPAIEQPALFDLINTVEMVLDYLETIHPASLLNQIMAVNLSMAYFSLVSTAGECLKLSPVQDSFRSLRDHIERALDVLARDVTLGISNVEPASPEHLPRYASVEAIRACEDACNAIGNVESLLSRVTSLLHKFPQQYDFVERTILNLGGSAVPLDDSESRNSILEAIREQQGITSALPRPSRRSYILRNGDADSPCQMCVRYGEDGVFKGGEGGLLIAVTKSLPTRKPFG